MSHSHERHEKTCLNCGTTPLHDRYCHHCGQENVEPRQTLSHLLVHFFEDVTHFDGKFFATMKMLLLKPGFLSAEYVNGKRTKYLDPVRMYLFISAAFFLVFTSVFHSPPAPSLKDKPVIDYIDSVRKAHKEPSGITFIILGNNNFGNKATLFDVEPALKKDYAYYDSIQNTLPAAQRSDLIQRFVDKRFIDIYKAYDANPYDFVANALNTFIHSFSKVFFISLPIFSFFLYLLYIRRRKKFYYVSHAIFSIHYYTVAFIFLLIPVVCYAVMDKFNASEETIYTLFNTTFYIIPIGLFVYLYIAILRFYKQGWLKSLIKFILLSSTYVIILLILVYTMFMNSLLHTH